MDVWEWAQYSMYLYSFSYTLFKLDSRGFNAEGSEMVLQKLIHLCFALRLWEPLVANLTCWITLHVSIKLVGLYCLSWTDSLCTVCVWPNVYWESYCLFHPPRNWGKATHSYRLSCVLVREGMRCIFFFHANYSSLTSRHGGHYICGKRRDS